MFAQFVCKQKPEVMIRDFHDPGSPEQITKESVVMSYIQPNLKQLFDELQHVRAKWRLLGLYLDVPNDELDAIDEDKQNLDDKLYALCCIWPHIKPQGTWKDVVKALKKIKRIDLAERLEEKYIKNNTSSYRTNLQQPCGGTKSPVTKESMQGESGIQDQTIDIPKDVIKNVNSLAAQFKSLLTVVQSALKQRLRNNDLNLENLGRFICNLLSVPYMPPCVTEGRDEIDTLFFPLLDHICFLHTGPFRFIDIAYLQCMLEAKIESYDDDLDEFMQSTTIIAFKEMIQCKGLYKGIPVILRLSRRWESCTLSHLRHLTQYLFKDSSSLLTFSVIHHSLLTIKYTAPDSLLLSFITMASRSIRGMKWAGIISIQVGTVILEINGTDYHPSKALMIAASKLFSDSYITDDIRLLINIGGDVNFKNVIYPNTTPLLVAASIGNLLTLKVLLQSKADPNLGDAENLSPLYLACHYGHHQCVNLLLQSKADPNIQVNYGVTALYIACQNGHYKCVDVLLKSNADPDIQTKLSIGATALYAASDRGHHQCVDLLLQSNADPNIQATNGTTALLIASQYGHHQCVDLLLKSKADPNIQAFFGITALYVASKRGHHICVDLLLKSNADPNIPAENGTTPLMAAVIFGHGQIVHTLLRHKSDPNSIAENSNPLSQACHFGDLSTVLHLLEYGAHLEMPGLISCAPLLIAVDQGHYDIVKALVNAGANINVQDEFSGATPLIVASAHGNLHIAHLLLQLGSNMYVKDNNGCTANMYADARDHHGIVTLLAETLYERAAKYFYSPSLEESSIPHSSEDDEPSGVMPPLISAVSKGRYGVAKALVRSGADVNVQDKDNATPLIVAAQGNIRMVRLLLQSGANMFAQDNKGYTANLVAVIKEQHDIVTLLAVKLYERAIKYFTSIVSENPELSTTSSDTQLSKETILNHMDSMLSSFQSHYTSVMKENEGIWNLPSQQNVH